MSDRSLPEGVVTFVFTDIEGSTRLLQKIGDEFASVLETHRSLLHRTFAQFDGHLVNTEGDGSFAAFGSPTAAVLAVAQAQREISSNSVLAQHGVKVRIGMNTGEAQRTGHDYVGLAVHQASRVANAGHGGQVLIADSTRLLASDSPDVEFEDLGEHFLKDFAGAVRIFQLRAAGLEDQFPRIRSLNSAESKLPSARTSFIGRANELNATLSELADPGLVTLTGAGGTGKTRLAIEAAREIRGSMDGAWFVDLQSVTEPGQVLDAAASALAVLDVGQPSGALDRLWDRIGDRPCLIVLDNCEHVLPGAAQLVDRLLDRCPALRILATSRDLLGVPDERARRVPPLDADSGVSLFIDRAARLASHFDPDDDERRQIDRICRRLDGIPLAIELAAARIRHMSVADLAERIEDVFQIVVGNQGRELQRHQTLQALVDWSYDLLSPDEQIVFRRLSVLTGGFSISAAEAVAEGDPLGAPVAETVFRLVDRSLVDHDGAGRYRQLETLRAYGRTKLQQTGELDLVRDRHMAYFVEFAERLGARLRTSEFFDAVEQLEVEARNLWAALNWADARPPGDASVLRLLAATLEYAAVTGRAGYMTLADRALADRGQDHPDLLVVCHVAFAVAATTMGWDHLRDHAVTALEMLGAEGPEHDRADELRAWTLASLALIETSPVGDGELTGSHAERAKALSNRCDLPLVGIAADSAVAWELMRASDVIGARRLLAAVRADAGDLRGSLWFAGVLFRSGIAAMRARDWMAAIELYQEVLPFFRRVRFKIYAQWVLDHLSEAALQLGDFAAARAYAEEGVAMSAEAGLAASGNIAHLYARLASLEGLRGDHARAARYYEQAIIVVTAHQDLHDEAAMRSNMAAELIQAGDLESAQKHIRASITLTEDLAPLTLPNGMTYPPPISNAVHAVARLALAAGKTKEAAELAGAVTALHPIETWSPATRQRMTAFRAAIAERLGDDEQLDLAFARGEQIEDPLVRAREVFESVMAWSTSG